MTNARDLPGDGFDDHGPDDDLADVAPLLRAPVRRPADVLLALVPVVGPEAGGPPTVWCLVLDADDVPLPFVVVIDDPPGAADTAFAADLATTLARVLDERALGGSVVVALVGRLGQRPDACARAWADVLGAAARATGVPLRAVAAIGPRGSRVLRWW